ncbi:hypothetical protein D3C79_719780 [compost metagenome]
MVATTEADDFIATGNRLGQLDRRFDSIGARWSTEVHAVSVAYGCRKHAQVGIGKLLFGLGRKVQPHAQCPGLLDNLSNNFWMRMAQRQRTSP